MIVHGLPATPSEQHKPWLVSVTPHPTGFPSSSSFFGALSSFPPPPCDPCRRGVQAVQRVVWSSLRSSALFLAFFNTGWSLDGTDGIGSGFWMEAEMPAGISLSAGFTNLHSGLDFKPLLPGFEFQNHLRWRWYFNTWLSRIVIPTQNKQNWGWISSR